MQQAQPPRTARLVLGKEAGRCPACGLERASVTGHSGQAAPSGIHIPGEGLLGPRDGGGREMGESGSWRRERREPGALVPRCCRA